MRTISEQRRAYPTDVSDEEWALMSEFIPEQIWFPNLQRPSHTAREMLNAIRYRTRTGVSWRNLPHDLPPWSTVFKTYQKWIREGVLESAHDALRRRVRREAGRNEEPSAAILDSQSVKSTDVGGPCGFDAGKKSKGTKTAHRGRRSRSRDGSSGDSSISARS